MNTWTRALIVAAFAACSPYCFADASPSETVIAEMAAGAKDFLASLDDAQKTKLNFELKDDERENWHFVPYARKGLPLKDLRYEQQHLAYAMLNTALSHEGFRKAASIMSLEKILRDLENNPTMRDPGNYCLSLFGTPDGKGTWGWRFEGHHFAMNFTIVGGKHIAVTPNFMGANPGVVANGPRQGLAVLSDEETLGFELAKSLTEEQRKTAVIMEKAPADIITGQERRAKILEPAGISADKLTDAQRVTLTKIIKEYVGRYRPEIADKSLAEWTGGGWDKVTFGWAGGMEAGIAHYYRIQSPKFLIEYDNIQNNARHPHAVWRDFKNDFGADLLAEHYKAEHQAK